MATQNVLDILGNIIGTITYPDGTAQSVFDAALALYGTAQPSVSVPIIPSYCLTATDNVTTSSNTPSILGSMSVLPVKGTYIAFFSGSIATAGASATGQFGIYVGGSLLSETSRPISCNLTLLGGLVTVSLNTIGVGTYTGTQVTLDGTQTLDVRFRSTNGGTIAFTERTLMLMRVS